MKLSIKKRRGWNLTAAVVALALLGSMIVMPPSFRTQAAKSNSRQSAGSNGIVYRAALENYDVRYDEKSAQGQAKLVALRQQASQSARYTASRFGQEMSQAKANLAARVGGLSVEMNPAGNAPEIVGIASTHKGALTYPSSDAHESIARGFLAQNKELYGLTDNQVAQLATVADYTNPAGNISWVEYEQRINGIPVFQGNVRAALTKDGEIARTTGNLVPGLDYAAMQTTPKMSASSAAAAAAKAVGVSTSPLSLRLKSSAKGSRSTLLTAGPFDEDIKADLVYFATEPGVATLAYSMTLWGTDADYYIIVDANDGQMLWRKNIRNEQTQSVSYNVYNDDSPAPSSPSIALTPSSGAQGAAIARSNVSVINEMPVGQTYSNDPWLADGAGNVVTTGNNVDAGLDVDGTNGIDAAGRATGVGRVLSFIFNPGPGIPSPGDAPTGVDYRNGAVTNIFFWTNRYHDRLYQLGFTEQARNFQTNNYGRGGLGNDFVRAEAQDSSGTNNANFSTPADGSLPRMQMFIFTGPTPDRDGDLDADISIHEMTHGTSNRLHNNASGLTTTQAGGMGEGWGDFYARALLSTADEDINGLYPAGGYSTNFIGSLGTANYYYGIRRFPYAIKTTTGANGKPHNPLTFADIDPARLSTTDGAFAESPLNFSGNGAAEVHNIGEIWCMALLEVRARLINRLGYAAGNQRALQLVTDGMKLDPTNPNLLQARDAIIAADNAGFGGADVDDIWAGFATRGMGFGAVTSGTSTVTESFLVPNLVLGTVTFSDAGGNNNGYADPGETIALTVPLTNPLGSTATGATATVNGITANYGNIAAAATVSQLISYTVPAITPCGAALVIPVDINSSFGPVVPSPTFTLSVGQPVIGFTELLDAVVAPALPAGWTTAHTGALADWVTSTTNASSAPNDAFSNEVTTAASSDLVTPDIAVNSASAQLTFKNLYNLEFSGTTPSTGFDGMVLEIAIPGVAGGAFQDILTAGGSFASGGYNKTISTGFSNPLAGRQAWSGLSAGTTAAPAYITSVVNLPAAASGKLIKLKWRRGDDSSALATGVAGVRIDSLQITTGSSCAPVNPLPPIRHPGDFDGDGKTDLLIFRPSEGKWYVTNSADNTSFSLPWGISTDKVVYGDYDGDGRGDFAVFRESEGNWYILNSTGPVSTVIGWGQSGDRPVPADYDGDGKTDVAVYRPADGNWYIKKSSGGSIAQGWGNPTDASVPADYDADGKADIAVFRPTEGNWYILKSSGGSSVTNWGIFGDKAVPGDYDGDRKADLAVFRPSEGNWYIKKSTGGSSITNWGNSIDKPVAADYDGDGKFDIAIWRESEANFYIINSATNTVSILNLGATGDIPVLSALIP
jgi:hypothetical protein